jgi:hypothetical protein
MDPSVWKENDQKYLAGLGDLESPLGVRDERQLSLELTAVTRRSHHAVDLDAEVRARDRSARPLAEHRAGLFVLDDGVLQATAPGRNDQDPDPTYRSRRGAAFHEP